MKQSKTVLIIGIILAILSIVAVSYEATTNYRADSPAEAAKEASSTGAPLVEKTLSLVNFLRLN